MPKQANGANDVVLGEHPKPPSLFGEVLSSADGFTATKVPHRALLEIQGMRLRATEGLNQALSRHHASEQAIRETQKLREAMGRLGAPLDPRLLRFPTNPNTRKGNLAEVVLAEYVAQAGKLSVPVYRLRYNPNVNQSMKGDDVLAFDFESDPVRILVGEAKFRGIPSRAAVVEIVDTLAKSHKGGIPISLQFVADRLFEAGNAELGTKVMNCAFLFASDRMRIDYVGLMLSDGRAAEFVSSQTPALIRQLAMISFGVTDPEAFAMECYKGLD